MYRSLSLSRLQHVVAADLHFSDRLLGPLISTHAHTSNRYYYFRFAYSGDSRGIPVAVVLVLTSLPCVDEINVQAVFSRSAVESGWESGGG